MLEELASFEAEFIFCLFLPVGSAAKSKISLSQSFMLKKNPPTRIRVGGFCMKHEHQRKLAFFRFFSSLYRDGEDGGHLRVQADAHIALAGFLDRLFKVDGVTIDDDPIGFELLVDVDAGHRTEGLAALTGGQGELRRKFGNLGRDLLEGSDLFGFAAGAGSLEGLDMAKVRAACLVGLALGNEEVPGVTSAYFDDICFGTKAFDFFFENDLCVGHEGRIEWGRRF